MLSASEQSLNHVSLANNLSMTRRDMESAAKRFWKYESTTITFYPLNADEPRLGGKVKASVAGFNVQTFMPYTKTYYGVFGEDFVTYGQFRSQDSSTIDSDSTMLKLLEESDADVVDKHEFKFSNNTVTYSRQVDSTVHDAEIEHAIEEGVLNPHVEQTWSETLFYGVGNKSM